MSFKRQYIKYKRYSKQLYFIFRFFQWTEKFHYRKFGCKLDFSLYTDGSFKITVGNGTAQTINISDATSIDDLVAKIQQAIDSNSELSGKVHVSNDGSKLTFISVSGETVKLTSGDSNNVLDKLDFPTEPL